MSCLICGIPARLYTNDSMLVRLCDRHKNDYAGMRPVIQKWDRCGGCRNLGQCCRTDGKQEG